MKYIGPSRQEMDAEAAEREGAALRKRMEALSVADRELGFARAELDAARQELLAATDRWYEHALTYAAAVAQLARQAFLEEAARRRGPGLASPEHPLGRPARRT